MERKFDNKTVCDAKQNCNVCKQTKNRLLSDDRYFKKCKAQLPVYSILKRGNYE